MAEHDALAIFLGDLFAEGTTYDQDGNESPWRSVHSARWHSGGFFVIQDERANGPFDTLAVMGWDRRANVTSRAPSKITATCATTPSPSKA